MSKFLRLVDGKLKGLSEDTAHDLADVIKRVYDNSQTIMATSKHLMTIAQHYGAHDNPKVLERAQEILKHTSTGAFLCAQLNGQIEKFRANGSDSSESGSSS